MYYIRALYLFLFAHHFFWSITLAQDHSWPRTFGVLSRAWKPAQLHISGNLNSWSRPVLSKKLPAFPSLGLLHLSTLLAALEIQEVPTFFFHVCARPQLTGHTFLYRQQEHLPRVHASSPNLACRATFPAASTFATAAIHNPGDTCVAFQAHVLGRCSAAFELRPCRGILPPHSVQICAVKFTPVRCAAYTAQARWLLNANGRDPVQVILQGIGDAPQLKVTPT